MYTLQLLKRLNLPYSDVVIVHAYITICCDEDKERKQTQVVPVNTSPEDTLESRDLLKLTLYK